MKISFASTLAYDDTITMIDFILEEGETIRKGDFVEISLRDETFVTVKIAGLGLPKVEGYKEPPEPPEQYSYGVNKTGKFFIQG